MSLFKQKSKPSTRLKRKIAKATGIPTTKSGRKRKVENTIFKILTGGKKL